MQNQPISGATLLAEMLLYTNASGAYSMSILSGTHSVTAVIQIISQLHKLESL
jgi:hypothetical protein